MRKFFHWVSIRFQELDLLPDYFTAVFSRWQALLWGGSMLAVLWGLHFIVGNPPSWVNWTAVMVAFFIASYYAWRADHTRLIPNFEISKYEILPIPITLNVQQVYVQVIPQCLTEAPVHECKGHLLRVYKKYSDGEDWQATAMNEPLDLIWSTKTSAPLTLQPGIDQRLNVCFRDSVHPARIMPATDFTPRLWNTVPNPTGIFRFEIRVTAKDCPPVDISVDVTFDGCEMEKPNVQLTQGFTSNSILPTH
jgi:hypothetical protein